MSEFESGDFVFESGAVLYLGSLEVCHLVYSEYMSKRESHVKVESRVWEAAPESAAVQFERSQPEYQVVVDTARCRNYHKCLKNTPSKCESRGTSSSKFGNSSRGHRRHGERKSPADVRSYQRSSRVVVQYWGI